MKYPQAKIQQHTCYVTPQTRSVWTTDPDFLFKLMAGAMYRSGYQRIMSMSCQSAAANAEHVMR